ncbi:MAG: EAL domain-containing protein [Rhizobiales bacterium]|nr:EAL domain-containing protein [Hyphomicrobiales bacterium]
MRNVRLRTLVATIGLMVTLTIFVSIPCGYFYLQFADRSHHLDHQSEQAAARVAKYVYLHRTLWQYQAPRIAELIELTETDGKNYALTVRDETGAAVASAGPALLAPVIVRSHPIVISGAVIGRAEAMSSLRPLLWQTGFAALLSAVFGIGIYFAVRVFPLTVLDRTLGALETANATIRDRSKQLQVQNERFDAALTHMSQGLVMFDSSARLVVCNKRYLEMFGLSPEIVRPGCTIREVLGQRVASGSFSADDFEPYIADLLAAVAQGTTFSKITNLQDGRIVSIVNQPTADGGWVATHEDITERILAEEKIRHLAHYDALTNLPNRVTFYERMETVLGHLRRSETIAVLSLDLDQFKNVNDTLGHPVGDRLLQAVAERIRSCVRGEDIVARLGGDEFAIMQVPSERPADITALATRLIEVVGAPYDINGHQVVVGTSVGIAIAPDDGSEPDALMKNADLALYRSKADGGGVYRFFEVAMDARMQARRALELDLRKAIVNGEFELYYQPIVNVKSGHATGCEALVRWHHPERGMIAPLEFIPVAEQTGLIVPLGEWILRQACAEAARWPQQVTIAVNLSPAQFKSRNLVPTVINALATSGLSASRLELEITELVLLQENEGAFVVLHQLRDLGIKIAMDDFGTGYSSLGYLRSFPFDKIKIDQSFIRDLPGKEDSVAIVRAVVGLSSSLGITTIAEGVETKEQLASLTAEGCNEVQGFLFSPPRPAADVQRTLGELGPRVEAVA